MDKLEEIYGIKIDNPVFFKRALTHPSYTKEKEIPYMSLILTAKENAKNINFEITLKSVYKLMDKMANKFIQEYY